MSEVRLIDANALTKIIEREIYYAENPTIHRTLNYVLGVIDNAPTVEPERPQGSVSYLHQDSITKSDIQI